MFSSTGTVSNGCTLALSTPCVNYRERPKNRAWKQRPEQDSNPQKALQGRLKPDVKVMPLASQWVRIPKTQQGCPLTPQQLHWTINTCGSHSSISLTPFYQGERPPLTFLSKVQHLSWQQHTDCDLLTHEAQGKAAVRNLDCFRRPEEEEQSICRLLGDREDKGAGQS